ncbi:MAG: histidine kinase dimerization/phospho-acceptor domain-containing protein, partial [Candidatus Omnitrophota bacterium]|nr:histidine kinase dimerization/phospho-acceptor domain-containing protein [Candidatus Omnitrophota bacterium]
MDRSLFKLPINEMYLQNEFLRQETADKEKFKAVASLASGLAHEIRNPLTALKTFFEYFPQKKDDPEFMQKFAPIAGREVERIENLTKQLLDFAKPSPPQMVGCSADQICRDCLSLIEHDLKNHNITLKTEFKTAEYQLKADPNQLKQALLNILLNAVEAMPNGGE